MDNKKWLLSSEDISLLVALNHTSVAFLPQFPGCVLNSENQVIECMHHLIEDEIIECSEIPGKYYVNGEISRIFDIINHSAVLAKVSSELFCIDDSYIYISSDSRGVLIESSENRKNVFKVSEEDVNEIFASYFDKSILPEYNKFDCAAMPLLSALKTKQELLDAVQDVAAEIEVYDKSLKKSIIVFQYNLDFGIAAIEDEKINIKAYSIENLISEIKKDTGGNNGYLGN